MESGEKVFHLFYLKRHSHRFRLFSLGRRGKMVRNAHIEAEIVIFHHAVEVVLVHIDGLDLLQLAGILLHGEIANDQLLERKLDILFGIPDCGTINNVDTLLWCDRPLLVHSLSPR
jgi:hypothetical protein